MARYNDTIRMNWKAFILCSFSILLSIGPVIAEEGEINSNYSGWRGGIGITFGNPGTKIPDVTELGYEIIWGGEHLGLAKALDIAIYRYWNSIVEISLKGSGYDFTLMEDKDKAAQLAFDAWADRSFGVKGLSKYAQVTYKKDGTYGDVYGVMDLTSENPLVTAVIDSYFKWFVENDIKSGGIALDNAMRVPQKFLELLSAKFHSRGLGVAANGSPAELYPYIDFFGREGPAFTPNEGREFRSKGLTGIMGEFTRGHLSPGELESYLQWKTFNGIVFFGYTDGDTAAYSTYSSYSSRPDVYNHQRWVLRKYIPLSRAAFKAGQQENARASITSLGMPRRNVPVQPTVPKEVSSAGIDPEGRVDETRPQSQYMDDTLNLSQISEAHILRFGNDIQNGIYFYTDLPGEVACDRKNLGITGDTVVFDEFNERLLARRLSPQNLEFPVVNSPTLVQLGSRETIAKNILSRLEEMFRLQLLQRKTDREGNGFNYPFKSWAPFCRGYKIDNEVARSETSSLQTVGGVYYRSDRHEYYYRSGAAQLVVLNQTEPVPIVLSGYSKARNVTRSDYETFANRREHFVLRVGYIYCMHLYLDYQDGEWPEVHTVSFTPGTHDWEKKTITVNPKKPVKTAMILLEFQQRYDSASAWFDDLFLAQTTEPDNNLLAYSGFETAPVTQETLNAAYEDKITDILGLLKETQEVNGIEKQIAEVNREIESLERWVMKAEMERIWGREIRDLYDAKEKLALCSKILDGK